MRVILPEYGAYFRDTEGRVRVSPFIYVQNGNDRVMIAIPPEEPFSCGMIEEESPPTIAGYRKAIYKRAEMPNCAGIARYDLVSVDGS